MNENDEVMEVVVRVRDALKRMDENKDDFLVDTHDVCSALEDLCAITGVDSLYVEKLRRELKKRGLRR